MQHPTLPAPHVDLPTPARNPSAHEGVWTAYPAERHMDIDTALTLLTPAEVDRIVTQARAPQISTFPTQQTGPGMIEAYLPGLPHPVYVHPSHPPMPPAPPASERPPVVDRWAVNTAVVSLSLSTAALISAFALHQAALAAAALVAALASMGWFLLALAVVLGVLTLTRGRAPAPSVHQTITQNIEVTSSGLLSRTKIDPAATITNNRAR
ncbi:hypothetical protein ACWGIR_30940 [Streptomyces albidoflavus]